LFVSSWKINLFLATQFGKIN